jgi:carboxynorspermidine decarboxylase|tara:strand:+ start:137164 stop:138330 length:1167 start_codon:yes stop_codon:yes gene_type:complete
MDHLVKYDPKLPGDLPSPCYVVDLERLRSNLELLREVQEASGAKILLALKGFAMHATFPLLREYLAGVTASGPHEAQLGHDFFRKEVHVYATAFSEADIEAVLPIAHQVSFNSVGQWERFRERIQNSGQTLSLGLRVNPEYSEVEVELYNPCAAGSRLGIRRADLEGHNLSGIEGLHFHTLCEQGAGTLARTLEHFEAKFGEFLPEMKWVNFGGGHHITAPKYDREHLVSLIKRFRHKWPHLQVYLEPGEAIGINTGVLASTVLDVVPSPEGPIAILDISATCHMPDVLEMPYRPEIVDASLPGERVWDCRLGGLSCLAGDMIGAYSFDRPLKIGDRVVFRDMAHYTMVKTTTFNGIQHPHLATWNPTNRDFKVVRRYGYSDYRDRLS